MAVLLQDTAFYNKSSDKASPSSAAPVNEFVQPPATFGGSIPQAFLSVSEFGVSRYDDLIVIFSHSMNTSTIVSAGSGTDSFILKDSLGNQVLGRFFWFGTKKLYFDPYKELKSYEYYTLTLTSDAKTTANVPLTFYSKTFRTRPGYNPVLTLTGLNGGVPMANQSVCVDDSNPTPGAPVPPLPSTCYNHERGFLFDSAQTPQMELNVSVNDSSTVSSMKLCKLSVGGVNTASAPKRCREDKIKPDEDLSDPGIELCSVCSASTSVRLDTLTDSFLKLSKGTNNYYLEIIDIYGNVTQKNINFQWAPLLSDSLTPPNLTASTSVIIDKSNSVSSANSVIPQLEYLIKKFARQIFTLNGKTFNQMLNDPANPSIASYTHPGGNCLAWNRKNVLNTAMADEAFQIHYLKLIGPFCGIQISGKGLPGASTYVKNIVSISGNTITLSPDTTNLSLEMLARNPAIPEHSVIKEISGNTIKLMNPFTGAEITPGAGLGAGSSISFDYSSFTALADVYVQSIYVDPNFIDAGNPDGFNVSLDLNPRNTGGTQFIEVKFGANKLSAKVAAVARVNTLQPAIAHAVAPPGSQFAFFDDPQPPAVGTVYEREGTAVGLNLNDSNPSFPKRYVYTNIAPTVIGAPTYNMNLGFSANPALPYYNQVYENQQFGVFTAADADHSVCFVKSELNPACSLFAGCNTVMNVPAAVPGCGNPFPSAASALGLNPNTLDLSNNVAVNNINITQGDDLITSILNSIAQVQIPRLKHKLAQSAVADVLTRMVPRILNEQLLDRLKTGVDFPMFNSLPAPIRDLKLSIFLGLTSVGTNETGPNTQNAISAEADIQLKFAPDTAVPANPAKTTLPDLNRNNSVLLKDAPISSVTPTVYDYKKIYGNEGILIGIHPDAVNQALYYLWKIGGLNLTIDSAFRADLISYVSAYNTPLIQLLDFVSTGRSIRSVLAPTKQSVEGRDSLNNPITVEDNDGIVYKLNWLLPPTVKGTFNAVSALEVPRMDVKISDLEVEIIGQRPAAAPVLSYRIALFRLSLNTVMDLDILVKSTNPTYPTVYGWHNYRNTIRMSFSKDPKDIRYIVEPGEPGGNPDRNPIGQDPKLLRDVLDPLVKSFIVPMLNDILYDVPLENRLEKCGVGLYNLKLVPVSSANSDPFLLIKSLIYDYNFTGNCDPFNVLH
ncbi:MAG TPA: Ig-like domain-containing protein [Leptospiraceae bacterium]|nr:Ig-like domain-containing protein [Leptospiraceae bacterium]HNM02271.1 Ig-like domain-containing protein [Leptospiraceae bacterium]HNN04164.1 Ig-like domain-containing protein [Leptospiraceae bacterium]